jgi:hypothetical protein
VRLIGINGLKGSGKDTAFECIRQIAEARNQTAERRAFADKLKVIAARVLGYEGNDAELMNAMNLMKEQGYVDSCIDLGIGTHVPGRRYLQLFGQRAREVFGEDFWINQVLPLDQSFSMANFGRVWGYPLPDYAVVTDVRYPNEAERVRELDGEVWQVRRPGLESDGHITEQPLGEDEVDFIINNDGTKDDLALKVKRLVDVQYVEVGGWVLEATEREV